MPDVWPSQKFKSPASRPHQLINSSRCLSLALPPFTSCFLSINMDISAITLPPMGLSVPQRSLRLVECRPHSLSRDGGIGLHQDSASRGLSQPPDFRRPQHSSYHDLISQYDVGAFRSLTTPPPPELQSNGHLGQAYAASALLAAAAAVDAFPSLTTPPPPQLGQANVSALLAAAAVVDAFPSLKIPPPAGPQSSSDLAKLYASTLEEVAGAASPPCASRSHLRRAPQESSISVRQASAAISDATRRCDVADSKRIAKLKPYARWKNRKMWGYHRAEKLKSRAWLFHWTDSKLSYHDLQTDARECIEHVWAHKSGEERLAELANIGHMLALPGAATVSLIDQTMTAPHDVVFKCRWEPTEGRFSDLSRSSQRAIIKQRQEDKRVKISARDGFELRRTSI